MENPQLPEGITEADAVLLVEGAQKHLQDRTVEPGPDEEMFYGEPDE